MTRKRKGGFFFDGRDQYVDEILEAGRRELEELRLEPDERKARQERESRKQAQEQISAADRLHAILGAVMAGLIIAGIFILGMFLFLLFATRVWLA